MKQNIGTKSLTHPVSPITRVIAVGLGVEVVHHAEILDIARTFVYVVYLQL